MLLGGKCKELADPLCVPLDLFDSFVVVAPGELQHASFKLNRVFWLRLRHSEAKAAERTAAVQDASRDFGDIIHRRTVAVSRTIMPGERSPKRVELRGNSW